MKLLIVRHGESTWNVEGRYQGRMDPPLSARGMRQAQALAAHLAGAEDSKPMAIVSSPLARARLTADVVGERVAQAIQLDDRLIEISHGKWEGLLRSEVEQRWPEEIATWRSDPEHVTFPGGESLGDVHRRWRAFVSGLGSFPSPLLIVTHDVIVRLAVLDARNEPLSRFSAIASENAALCEMSRHEDALRLVRVNDTSFLGADRADAASQAL